MTIVSEGVHQFAELTYINCRSVTQDWVPITIEGWSVFHPRATPASPVSSSGVGLFDMCPTSKSKCRVGS